MNLPNKSPRKRVAVFTSAGILRAVLEQSPNGLFPSDIDLIVRVVLNYCETNTRRKTPPRKK